MSPKRVRLYVAALLCAGSALAAADAGVPGEILILTSSAVPAYADALHAFQASAPRLRTTTLDLSDTSVRAGLPQEVVKLKPRLIVAVGSHAVVAATSAGPAIPVIATMVLDGGNLGMAGSGERIVGTVDLAVPGDAVLAALQRLFPGKNRLVVIRSASRTGRSATLFARAREYGFTVRFVDCSGPEELVQSLVSLREEADFVWCVPDTTLYNTATVKSLITVSLQHRLPIIGFSESFVRAGAALGVYADFAEIGRQTADMANKYLAGQGSRGTEYPKKITITANERVLRLLGLRSPNSSEVMLIR